MAKREKLTFIDLFAGCGGLSLGLMQAGWQGIFAVERDRFAYETLKTNLLGDNAEYKFDWPDDLLPKEAIAIGRLINKYGKKLESLKDKIDLVAGGPPCQGFSFMGRRKKNDSRNSLYKPYIKFVRLIQPKYLLIENVRGIGIEFNQTKMNKKKRVGRPPKSYATRIKEELKKAGYVAKWQLVKADELGIPQFRPRFIMIGIKEELYPGVHEDALFEMFFSLMGKRKKDFLKTKGLPTGRPVSVSDAISDLETTGKELVPCEDAPKFKQIRYERPGTQSEYLKILHGNMNGEPPNSLRLAKHREKTIEVFEEVRRIGRPGVTLSDDERQRGGVKKNCLVVLDANKPSHTLTTLPDDMLHYSEPRILTVRECARLQSFPCQQTCKNDPLRTLKNDPPVIPKGGTLRCNTRYACSR